MTSTTVDEVSEQVPEEGKRGFEVHLDNFEGPFDLLLGLIAKHKLDITEEKVRLRSHCDYFLAALAQDDAGGKKLGFISQEIGREINTMDSKANDAGIQQVVVGMKEELEKIKEQLLNVL